MKPFNTCKLIAFALWLPKLMTFMSLFLDSNKYVLLFCYIVLFTILISKFKYVYKTEMFYYLVLVIVMIWGLLDNFSTNLLEIYQKILIYNLIPLFFVLRIDSTEEFLKYNSRYALISFAFNMIDPFLAYKLTGNYMSFGYFIILPVLASLLVHKIFDHNFKLFSNLTFLFISIYGLVFSNRGIALSVFTFLIILMFTYIRNQKYISKVTIFTVFTAVNVIIIVNIKILFETINHYLIELGLYSYSLTIFINTLATGNIINSVERLSLYNQSIDIIKHNILIGNGLAFYEVNMGIGSYPHNIFIDILINGGLLQLIFLIVLFVYSLLIVISLEVKDYKIIYLLFFLIAFPKLFYSYSYIYEYSFWFLILYPLSRKKSKKPKVINSISYDN